MTCTMAEGPHLTDADLARPARILPLKIIRGLGNQLHRPLNAGGNWEILAEELGFETEDIKRINATANVRQDVTPGELLLCTWSRGQRGSGYTLFALRNALIQVDRYDCVEYLESEVYNHVIHMDLKVCVRDENFTGSINHLQVRTRTESTLLASLQNVLQQPITTNYTVLDHGATWYSMAKEFKGRQLMLQKTNNVEPMPLDQDPTVDSSSIVDTTNTNETNQSSVTVSPICLPVSNRAFVNRNSPQVTSASNVLTVTGQMNSGNVAYTRPETIVSDLCISYSEANQFKTNRNLQISASTSNEPVQNNLNVSVNRRESNMIEICNTGLNISRTSHKILNVQSSKSRVSQGDGSVLKGHMQETSMERCSDNTAVILDNTNGNTKNVVNSSLKLMQRDVNEQHGMENVLYVRDDAVENSDITTETTSSSSRSILNTNDIDIHESTPKIFALKDLQSQRSEAPAIELDDEMMDLSPTACNVDTTLHQGQLNVRKSRVESNRVLSAYEIHRHLEPSCAQPSNCETHVVCSKEVYRDSSNNICHDEDDDVIEYKDSENWLDKKRDSVDMEVFTPVTEDLDPELEATLKKELFPSELYGHTLGSSSSDSDKEMVTHRLCFSELYGGANDIGASEELGQEQIDKGSRIDEKPVICSSIHDVGNRASRVLNDAHMQAHSNAHRLDMIDISKDFIREGTHDDFDDPFYERQSSFTRSNFGDNNLREQKMDDRKFMSDNHDGDNEDNVGGTCSYIDFDRYPQDEDITEGEFYRPETNEHNFERRQYQEDNQSFDDRIRATFRRSPFEEFTESTESKQHQFNLGLTSIDVRPMSNLRCMQSVEQRFGQIETDKKARYGYESLQRHVSCPADMYGSAKEIPSPLPTIADVFTPVTDEPRGFGLPIEDSHAMLNSLDDFDEDQSLQRKHRFISLPAQRRTVAFRDPEKRAFRHTIAEGQKSSSPSELHKLRSLDQNLDIIDLPPPLPHRKSKVISHPYKVVVGRRPSSHGTDGMLADDKLFSFFNGKLKGHLGWSPLETEYTVERTMRDLVHQDGFYILWYNRTKRNLMITVSDHGKNIHIRVHSKVLDNHLFFYVIRGCFIKDVRQLLQDCIEQGLSIQSTRILGTRQEVERKIWMRCPVIVEYERKPAVSV